jgi:hypothetical protein
MQEVECIRQDGSGVHLDEYLKNLMQEIKVEIKLSDFKSSASSEDGPLILIATADTLSEVRAFINKRKDKLIIGMNSRKDFKLVAELKDHFSKIFGFVDLSQEIEYNIPVMKNYLSMNFTRGTLPLDKLANELDKIYKFTQSELVKIKDLHDRFVKVREDKMKGVTLTSKFMAGEKSGGEFFEILQDEHEVIFIQAGSDSYILSSLLLGEIQALKEKINGGSLQTLTEQFIELLNYHCSENKGELTYCIMSLNLKSLNVSFKVKGQGHLFFNDEWISFDAPIKLKLRPKQRLLIISDGAFKNWTLLSKKPVAKFFKTNSAMSTKDLIKEFFFEVSRNKKGHFLDCDALMATVEIEESRIYQV